MAHQCLLALAGVCLFFVRDVRECLNPRASRRGGEGRVRLRGLRNALQGGGLSRSGCSASASGGRRLSNPPLANPDNACRWGGRLPRQPCVFVTNLLDRREVMVLGYFGLRHVIFKPMFLSMVLLVFSLSGDPVTVKTSWAHEKHTLSNYSTGARLLTPVEVSRQSFSSQALVDI